MKKTWSASIAGVIKWCFALVFLVALVPAFAATCSTTWRSKAYLNEYYFGTGSTIDFLELYSTTNTFPISWSGWSIEVYTESGALSGAYTKSNTAASSCTQKGKTWVTMKLPAGQDLVAADFMAIAKDGNGDIVDAFISAGNRSKASNVYNANQSRLSVCNDLYVKLGSDIANTAIDQTGNLLITGGAGNKNAMRSPDGGSGATAAYGNILTTSNLTGSPSTVTNCTSNNSSFSKSVSVPYASPGSPLTYTLTFKNIDNKAISNVIEDDLPPELGVLSTSNLSASAGTSVTISPAASTPQKITWTISNLAAAGTATLLVNATIPNNLALIGTTLTNRAATTVEPIQSDVAVTEIVSSESPSFIISAPSTASACSGSNSINVTITAMTELNGGGTVKTNYLGSVLLSTSIGEGTWTSTGNGTLTPSGSNATYQFVAADLGVAAFTLSGITTETSVVVSALDINYPAIQGFSNPIDFVKSATLAILDQDWLSPSNVAVAARPHRFKVQIIPSCGQTPPTGSPAVAAWYAPSVRSPISAQAPKVALTATSAGVCGTSITLPVADPGTNNLAALSFTSGIGWIYLCTTDVGQFSLNMRIPRQTAQGISAAINGSSSELTVRPFALRLTAPADTGTTNTLVTTALPTTWFRKAGTDYSDTTNYGFGAKATAVLWNAADDTEIAPVTSPLTVQGNGLVAAATSGAIDTINIAAATPAPSFGQERPTVAAISLSSTAAAPIGGAPGTLSYVSTATNQWNIAWNEVGALSLGASLVGSSYMGSGANLTGRAAPISRFIPDHFTTAITTSPMICSSLFSTTVCPSLSDHMAYAKQPFTVKVNAMAAGLTPTASTATRNFTGDFAHDVTLSAFTGIGSGSASPGTMSGNVVPAASFAATMSPAKDAGQASTNLVSFAFTASPSVPANIYIRAVDGSEVTSLRSTAPTTSSIEGGIRIISGRLKASNAFGSEMLALTVPLTVQYYTADGFWATNASDSFSTWTASPSGAASLLGTDASGSTTIPTGGGVSAGSSSLTASAPGSNARGYVNITLDVPDYLKFAWTTVGAAANPVARLSFGLYNQIGNSKKIIYRREMR